MLKQVLLCHNVFFPRDSQCSVVPNSIFEQSHFIKVFAYNLDEYSLYQTFDRFDLKIIGLHILIKYLSDRQGQKTTQIIIVSSKSLKGSICFSIVHLNGTAAWGLDVHQVESWSSSLLIRSIRVHSHPKWSHAGCENMHI